TVVSWTRQPLTNKALTLFVFIDRRNDMSTEYWAKPLTARLRRRRVLAGTATSAMAAVFMTACGGGSSGDSGASKPENEPTSGLLAKREDTTKVAKRGGTLKLTNPADPPHFDPHLLTL